MADDFSVSINTDNTSQQGAKFERKSDKGIDKNPGDKTTKSWQGPEEARKSKGSGKYPNQPQILNTRSGHNVVIDDSKGNESITIQHRSGTAIQFMPNGAMHMVTHNGKYDIVFGENRMTITGAQDITVKGEGSMLVYGDYRQTVHGNMEVACTGSYNITAKDVIMNPRNNFTIAGKTGTMKFDDSVQISAEQTAGIVAGKNAMFGGKDVTAVGGGKTAFLAGKETASVYSDSKTYVMGKSELHLKGEKSKLTGSDQLDLKGQTTKLSGDTVDISGSPVKIKDAQIDGYIKLAMDVGGGPMPTPDSASSADDAEKPNAKATSAPSGETTSMPDRA